MNSWYNNTLDDTVSTNVAQCRSDIDWMNKNRFTNETMFANLYISSSLIHHQNFPSLVNYAFTKNIKFGIAYSQTSQIDSLLSFNSISSNTIDKKLWFAVTELEPYNTGDYSGMTAKMEYAYPRLKNAGLKHGVYAGWMENNYWQTIVKNCDYINLHCYRPSASMTATGIYNYVKDRLQIIAAAAMNMNKIMEVNILYSCEPDFAYNYFQANTWNAAHNLFMQQYNINASNEMRRQLVVNDFSIFVSRFGKQIKP